MLIAGVLVFFMQAGFSLLEAGTVRFKNYQNILLKNIMDACIGGMVWWMWGYGLAYGEGNGFIGEKFFFGIGFEEKENNAQYGGWFFQYAFAATAATIVSGSLSERVNIGNYLLFSFLMTGFIYPVVVAGCWSGDGWLVSGKWNDGQGYEDFAGSGIVHLTGGVAGFVGAIILGPRIGVFDEDKETGAAAPAYTSSDPMGYETIAKKYKDGEWDILRVHQFIRSYIMKLDESAFQAQSPQQVVLGTLILWVGWLLFNGGSSFGAVGDAGVSASRAMMNTIVAPSAAGLVTFALEQRLGGNTNLRYNFSALTNGILAGLVSITASCDRVHPWAAFVIGCIGALVYIGSCRLMAKLKIDDPLEASQVHGFCGIWGVIALAFFKADEGIFYGGEKAGRLLGAQVVGLLFIIAWVGILSGLFFAISKKFGVLRLSYTDEILGGDIHYFGPLEFTGNLYQYDIEEGLAKKMGEGKAASNLLNVNVNTSPHRKREG